MANGQAFQAPHRRRSAIAILLCLIFVTGTGLRFLGVGWDGYAGLNPDERHMIFAASHSVDSLKAAGLGFFSGLRDWFDPASSLLSPRHAGFFYVYGDLPHTAITAFLRMAAIDAWPQRLQAGRILAAALDSGVILVVFFTGRRLRLGAVAALAGAGLYALTPLALQHAGYFVVDGPGTGFVALFLLLLAVWATGGPRWSAAAAGLALAAAVACKISLAAAIVAAPVAALVRLSDSRDGDSGRVTLVALGVDLGVLTLVMAAGVRLLNPSAFAGPGLFGLLPNPVFVEQLTSLARMMSDLDGVPSSWQWTVPGVQAEAWYTLAAFCFGPAIVALALIGAGNGLWRSVAGRGFERLLVPIAMVAIAVALLAHATIPAVRYALPAAPALAVLAGAGWSLLWRTTGRAATLNKALALVAALVAMMWGAAAVDMHLGVNPRVAATRWMEAALPRGTVIANETPWDDNLPLMLVRGSAYAMVGGLDGNGFKGVVLGLTDRDDIGKATRVADGLNATDILVISSDRQSRPMRALTRRFPMIAAYYRALESGALCFAEVARFDRRFGIGGLGLDDTETQEIWRNYDRPRVRIFRKQPCFDRDRVLSTLVDHLIANP